MTAILVVAIGALAALSINVAVLAGGCAAFALGILSGILGSRPQPRRPEA